MPSSSDLTSALRHKHRQQAEADEVEIRLHSIIYKVIEEMEDAHEGYIWILSSKRKSSGKQLFVKPLRSLKWVPSGGFMVPQW